MYIVFRFLFCLTAKSRQWTVNFCEMRRSMPASCYSNWNQSMPVSSAPPAPNLTCPICQWWCLSRRLCRPFSYQLLGAGLKVWREWGQGAFKGRIRGEHPLLGPVWRLVSFWEHSEETYTVVVDDLCDDGDLSREDARFEGDNCLMESDSMSPNSLTKRQMTSALSWCIHPTSTGSHWSRHGGIDICCCCVNIINVLREGRMRGDKSTQWGTPDPLSHILNIFSPVISVSLPIIMESKTDLL